MQSILTMEFGLGIFSGAIAVIVYLYYRQSSLIKTRTMSQRILRDAKEKVAEERRIIVSKAKEDMYRKKSEFELDVKRRKIEFQRLEHKHQQREENISHRESRINSLKTELQTVERDMAKRQDTLTSDETRLKRTFEQLLSRLEAAGSMSRDEARRTLLETLRDDVKFENQRWIVKNVEETRIIAREKSIDILCNVMQRYTAEQVTLHSGSSVQLPNEEMKGRVIGKEGRNIKALEMATGMEFIIGDTPELITISGFNPIRREIARRALTKLVADGRINPTRIEEVVAQCESELNENIEEIGQDTVLEADFPGMHRELITALGKLHFRTSYTQNVLAHAKEVSHFARLIAEELGLDGRLAARCGLLHDIGKSASSDIDGSHASVGADMAKRCGENQIVIDSIASHHEDVPYSSIYGVITHIADAVSATRPGARKETLAAYLKRLEQLEEIATSFDGVKKAYALQAGREVRIIVQEDRIDDEQATILARDVAKKVEEEMNFPGQIKVNVIREKRAIEYAR
ncbi:ribonuclease Y [Candidatus Babeliales bacterium]|nr:ribonuclease Y [Candidatus Babeliales bacterium]